MEIQNHEDIVDFYNVFSNKFLRSSHQIYNVIILFLNIFVYIHNKHQEKFSELKINILMYKIKKRNL